MKIRKRMSGFLSLSAHPLGCEQNVLDQVNACEKNSFDFAKNVLIIGGSTGYGLSSLISASYAMNASTISISYERKAENKKLRTASAGWYNLAAFSERAKKDNKNNYTLIADAFLDDTKSETIELIKNKLGKIDLVIYSVAAARRKDPVTGEIYNSVIKPIESDFTAPSINLQTSELCELTSEKATDKEAAQTVKVMGGEDWKLWMKALRDSGVADENTKTIAFDYEGPELTNAIYKNGTIGAAKKDLLAKQKEISEFHKAYISVNKAVMTQASAAIPAVPLYLAMLDKVLDSSNTNENCIDQILRLFSKIQTENLNLDENDRIRMDEYEMDEIVQKQISKNWEVLNNENYKSYADVDGIIKQFSNLFGFDIPGIDYDEDVEIDIKIQDALIL